MQVSEPRKDLWINDTRKDLWISYLAAVSTFTPEIFLTMAKHNQGHESKASKLIEEECFRTDFAGNVSLHLHMKLSLI